MYRANNTTSRARGKWFKAEEAEETTQTSKSGRCSGWSDDWNDAGIWSCFKPGRNRIQRQRQWKWFGWGKVNLWYVYDTFMIWSGQGEQLLDKGVSKWSQEQSDFLSGYLAKYSRMGSPIPLVDEQGEDFVTQLWDWLSAYPWIMAWICTMAHCYSFRGDLFLETSHQSATDMQTDVLVQNTLCLSRTLSPLIFSIQASIFPRGRLGFSLNSTYSWWEWEWGWECGNQASTRRARGTN